MKYRWWEPMSDLDVLGEKTVKGMEWRGTITVEVDDEQIELCIRQLNDGEFREVMSLIDRDELASLQSDIPDDDMERYRELSDKDELTDEESEEFSELTKRLEENTGNLFEVLSDETFKGIQKCAKYCVVPDEDDLNDVFRNQAAAAEDFLGEKVEKPEDVRHFVEYKIDEWIDNSTNFTSFAIGIKCLVETVGDEKN